MLRDAIELPFTRVQAGIEVPPGQSEVIVEGHDSEDGYGGETRHVGVP